MKKKICKVHGDLFEKNIESRENISPYTGEKRIYLSCKLCKHERREEFNKKNPQYRKDYYEKNKEKILKNMKEWYKKNINLLR